MFDITNLSVERAELLRILASNVSAIRDLSLIFMTKSKDQYIIHFYELLNNWSKYQPYPQQLIMHFTKKLQIVLVFWINIFKEQIVLWRMRIHLSFCYILSFHKNQ